MIVRFIGRLGLRAGMMGLRAGVRTVAPGTRFTLRSFLRTFIPGIPRGGPHMPKLTVKIMGVKSLLRALERAEREHKKCGRIAIKNEGIRLMKLLKDEIRSGDPGGSQFRRLTYLSRAWGGSKRLRPNKPLRKLAAGIRYHVKDIDPFDMRIGWVGPRTSKSSKRIAKLQQEGFSRPVTESRERSFRAIGAGMSKRSVARKYMFLLKGTTEFRTPARPIVEPFWNKYRGQAWRNIQNNYRRKMRGERI